MPQVIKFLPLLLQGAGSAAGQINPTTGMPYGTMSDEIIPQGGRFPGDPGSGGIGGGSGPRQIDIGRPTWDERIEPVTGPGGQVLMGEDLLKFLKTVNIP